MASKRKPEATTANKLFPQLLQVTSDDDEIFVPRRKKPMLNEVSIPYICSRESKPPITGQEGEVVATATSDVTASSSWQRKVTHGSDMDIPLLRSNDEGYQGDGGTATSQNTTQQVDKAGAGRIPTIPTALETPGDPENPWTFIDIDMNEQKLGAYVGFSEVQHLRTFLVSSPVIDAYLDFGAIASNINKIAAFRLLYRDEPSFKDSQGNVIDQTRKTYNKVLTEDEKGHHLACTLLQMEQSIGRMEQNIGNIGGDGTRSRNKPGHHRPMPNLGPHPGEHRLESINRCWALVNHFRNCTMKGNSLSSFSPGGIPTSTPIDPSHLPTWMRLSEKTDQRGTQNKPQAQETPHPVTQRPKPSKSQVLNEPEAMQYPPAPDKLPQVLTAATVAATALPPLSIPILWDRKSNFCGKAALDKALSEADLLDIPSSVQAILKDSSLTSSFESFQDHIRKLYNCRKLLMDIRALRLSYESPEWGGIELSVNMGQQTWSDTERIFQDPANSQFKLRVVFEAVDKPTA